LRPGFVIIVILLYYYYVVIIIVVVLVLVLVRAVAVIFITFIITTGTMISANHYGYYHSRLLQQLFITVMLIHRGLAQPFFDGWFIRLTDLEQKLSCALIVGL
jgi:hypothetical protein